MELVHQTRALPNSWGDGLLVTAQAQTKLEEEYSVSVVFLSLFLLLSCLAVVLSTIAVGITSNICKKTAAIAASGAAFFLFNAMNIWNATCFNTI